MEFKKMERSAIIFVLLLVVGCSKGAVGNNPASPSSTPTIASTTSNSAPVPGIAIASGGGVSSTTEMQLYLTIGQAASSVPVQNTPNILLLPGIQGIMKNLQ